MKEKVYSLEKEFAAYRQWADNVYCANKSKLLPNNRDDYKPVFLGYIEGYFASYSRGDIGKARNKSYFYSPALLITNDKGELEEIYTLFGNPKKEFISVTDTRENDDAYWTHDIELRPMNVAYLNGGRLRITDYDGYQIVNADVVGFLAGNEIITAARDYYLTIEDLRNNSRAEVKCKQVSVFDELIKWSDKRGTFTRKYKNGKIEVYITKDSIENLKDNIDLMADYYLDGLPAREIIYSPYYILTTDIKMYDALIGELEFTEAETLIETYPKLFVYF